MKKYYFTIITLFVYCNLFAYTQMHIYEDAGEFTFDADYIDSIKYVKETLKINDDTTDKKYAITYLDDDGDTLKVDSLDYGSTPNYKPNEKWSSKFKRYIYFNNWMPTITKVKSDAVYTAVYDTTHHSTYCFVYIDYKDSILSKVIADNSYGWTEPENVPVKEKNLICEYGYNWLCKYSDDYNKIWKEILDSTFIKYVIVLKDDEGRKISEKKGTYLYVPPSKIFVPYLQGWKGVSSWTRDNSLEAHDTIIYTAKFDDTEVSKLPESSLHSVFPISDTTSAYFSKGNLQYNAGDGNTHKTADSTAQGTWRFAERQYDYVGEENIGKDSSYNGWVDLFEWGSSGWEGNHDHKDYVALNTAQCRNADWGVYNAISNGGDEPRLWRTLSFQEWAYLLNRSNWGFAKIGKDSTLCLVIFPSEFITPDTMNIVYASTSDKNDFYERSGWIGYSPGITDSNTNTFTDEEFEELEARGVVALPFAGHVWGNYSSSNEFNEYGNIWTSNHNVNFAHEIYFGKTFSSGYVETYIKKSVRLVHVVE